MMVLVVSACVAEANYKAAKGSLTLENASAEQHKGVKRRSVMGHESGPGGSMDPYSEPVPKPPVMDSEVSVVALFGGDSTVTCELVAAGGFCFLQNFETLFEAVCPLSCNYTGEWCEGNKDDMFQAYLGSLWPADSPEMGLVMNMGCEAIPMLPDIGMPSGSAIQIFRMCDEPTVATTCAATCNTNCWAFPPAKRTSVFLPSCQQTLQVPDAAHRLMRNTYANLDQPSVCPP